MKVRVGYGLGTQPIASPETRFPALVAALEREGFDSLWLSERITSDALDPVVACTWAAARTAKLKLGFSVLVLPGRNVAVLAKELASLDVLSQGRLLPAFGLGIADEREQRAFGVARGERAALFDKALTTLRRLWAGEEVDGVTVRPQPGPLDVWLGGRAPSELRRVGRLADGWLPSFTTPPDAAAGRAVIEQAAAEAGRAVDPEHWGVLVPYARHDLPDTVVEALRRRRPDADPADVIPAGLPALRALLERFVEVGFSKFVVVPVAEPDSWDDEIGEAAAELLPLQA
ncbi:MAG TPA: LLM class flavin-dependent oxidoreductase [Acidimicrobiales bacterium]|nr:LLM class flavin-dependent oxidoreductase [Acidimicrobiales bacterium]